MKILLKGVPGTGKSTIVQKIRDNFHGEKYGILALEIRNEQGQRIGFKTLNLENKSRVFMHISDIKSDVLIGNKYYVDVDVINNFITEELKKGLDKENALVLIDEIGRAQACSQKFINTVRQFFESKSNFLGTIVYEDEDWSLEFKNHPEVILLEVTKENRDYLPDILLPVFQNNHFYNNLTSNQKEFVNKEFHRLFVSNHFIQIKKLFKNSIPYISDKRVKIKSEVKYSILGNTNEHTTIYDKSTNKYSCDCDLYLGKNQYEGKSGECSHILAVKIYNL